MTTDTATAPEKVTRRDIHQQVTDTIIRQLENGTVPWHKPWSGNPDRVLSIPQNFTTGKNYRGINILLLWASSLEKEYTTDEWASLKQWNEKKEYIRKGEKGSLIVYYDTLEKEVEGEVKHIPYLKSSYVFNRCQLASYDPAQPTNENAPKENLVERIYNIESFIGNTNAIVEHHGSRAFYHPKADKIVMPLPESFTDSEVCSATEGYYCTLLHELIHWSGHSSRLDRQGGKKFGDKDYATEELVAELGAAFLCSEFNIETAEKGNHASYIDHWLNVLKENKHCLITAASEASKSCDFLMKLQP